MAKVNLVSDLLKNHSDAELIEHMYRIMGGTLKNYKIALDKNAPEILWGNLGDIEQVASILNAMNKREQERLARSQAQ